MSSGPKTTTTNTSNTPWSGIQGPLYNLYANTESLQQKEFFPGQSFIPRNEWEHAADEQRLGNALYRMPGQIGQAQDAWGGLLGAMDVGNNPYVNNMMDVNAQNVTDAFQRNILPSISDEFQTGGGLGSNRYQIAQGLAAEGATKALAQANAQTQMDAYGKGLEAQKYALGYAPQMLSLGNEPGNIMEFYGQGLRDDETKMLMDDMARFEQAQQAPFDLLDFQNRMLQGGMNFGTQTSTGANPNYRSPLQTALGGSMMLLPFL